MKNTFITTQATYTRHYAQDHRAFRGHFPGRPLLPGVFYLREILTILPEEISRLPYVIKQARFIKMVTFDESLHYVVSKPTSISAKQIEVVTLVQGQSKEIVAKIHLIFKAGEKDAD